MGGTMALAALEALTAGVEVRCEVVWRDRHGRLVAKVYSPKRVGPDPMMSPPLAEIRIRTRRRLRWPK